MYNTVPAGRVGIGFMSEDYSKRLVKIIAELTAIAIVVVLLQFFVDWVGFEFAWPALLVVLMILVFAIAGMRK